LILGPGRETVNSRQIDEAERTSIRQPHDAGVLFNGDTRKIGNLLAQAGETIEKCSFAGVGGPNYRHYAGCRGRRYKSDSGGCPEMLPTPHRSRTFNTLAFPRRRATSEPSTWKTRGSPPGALKPAVIHTPGRNPSSISRCASSPGRSMWSRIAASPR